ncbi:hypothetical protein GETHLI_35930 [Geothrix limicola]|uniref:Uncharacterized protein n=1 Tax=Geothrix limicola TaxID=2927978 RepID=A0ABQ5QLK0_9BACT|nr:hypothetical protein [Geothrix limicola]GLH75090.1 hypothetical protein GETHLI_35930 [Geothrix limicola]
MPILAPIMVLICMNPPQVAPVSILKPGLYLSNAYIEMLKKTRSPYWCCKHDQAPQIQLEVSNTKTNIWFCWGFHESDTAQVLNQDGSTTRLDGVAKTDRLRIAPSDPTSFSVLSPRNATGQYSWVNSEEQFFRTYTVAGNYQDSYGRSYVFGVDGKGVFPNRTFTYSVGHEFVEVFFDCMYVEGATWGFESEGDILRIYECTDSEGPPVRNKKPFLTLKRLNP